MHMFEDRLAWETEVDGMEIESTSITYLIGLGLDANSMIFALGRSEIDNVEIDRTSIIYLDHLLGLALDAHSKIVLRGRSEIDKLENWKITSITKPDHLLALVD